MKKYTSNSSKGSVFEADLENPKELRKLHNDYPLDPDKIEIKIEMLSQNASLSTKNCWLKQYSYWEY